MTETVRQFENTDGRRVFLLVPSESYCLACDGSDAPMVKAQLEDLWLVHCDCGSEIRASGEALRSGLLTSCGECVV